MSAADGIAGLGLPAQVGCRCCGATLDPSAAICDLGAQPLANALLTEDDLHKPEVHHPLRPLVCGDCLLVQLPDVPRPTDIFTASYPFFSGQSVTWMEHCVELARWATHRWKLGPDSLVLDIGSNDGTMLRPFRARGIPCLGIEPSAGVGQHALMEGLPTVIGWWGTETAERLRHTAGLSTHHAGWQADLVICTNVLAHVPDLKDFLDGVEQILTPEGVAVFEMPYVGNMIHDVQFDQIYAEHHCYFSLKSLVEVLQRSGLYMREVEWSRMHGGSMRVTASTSSAQQPKDNHALVHALTREADQGLHDPAIYTAFRTEPPKIKRNALRVLAECGDKRIVGYGASAKAAVALNYFGLGPETIEFVADTTPAKQGKYLPGCRIPIRSPEAMEEAQPDVVVLLAWNWAAEAVPKIKAACPDAEIITLHGGGWSQRDREAAAQFVETYTANREAGLIDHDPPRGLQEKA